MVGPPPPFEENYPGPPQGQIQGGPPFLRRFCLFPIQIARRFGYCSSLHQETKKFKLRMIEVTHAYARGIKIVGLHIDCFKCLQLVIVNLGPGGGGGWGEQGEPWTLEVSTVFMGCFSIRKPNQIIVCSTACYK